MAEGRSSNPAIMGLISAAVAAWIVYDMATAAETPRQAVMILQWVLLAGALIGVGGAIGKAMSQK
jgi:thiol:disulfide interchange protein